MRTILISLLIFIFCNLSFSQEMSDTTFNTFDFQNPWNTNIDVYSGEGENLFIIYEYNESASDVFMSIVRTDDNLNELSRIDTLRVGRKVIEDAKIINYDENSDEALIFSNIEEGTNNLYLSYKLNLFTSEVNVKDTITINGYRMGFNDFIELNDTSFQAFGTIINRNNDNLKSFQLKFNDDGDFYEYSALSISPETIMSATHIEDMDKYFLTTYFGDFIVLDEDFNEVQRIDKYIEYTDDDGIEANGLLSSRYCEVNSNSINCIGRTIGSGSFAVANVKFPISQDSIGSESQVNPLFEADDYNDFTQSTLIETDSEGYIYAVTNGNFSPFGSKVDTNKLFISKINQNFKNEYFITFMNDTEMFVRDISISENDYLVIVGEHWSTDFPGERRNFYLKVNTDGTLTSVSGTAPPEEMMIVYPNPTRGEVNLKNKTDNLKFYEVYNINGEKVKSAELQPNEMFNIRNLLAGTYFIHFMNKNGQVVKKSKVVKY